MFYEHFLGCPLRDALRQLIKTDFIEENSFRQQRRSQSPEVVVDTRNLCLEPLNISEWDPTQDLAASEAMSQEKPTRGNCTVSGQPR